ncbi:MAG: hypothetical protein OXH79_04445 [Boseongicola sp.]|nr:hypothetical protein [Boseongicola sp.]
MVRHQTTAKSFPTRLGRVEVERTYFHCRSCGGGSFPLDRALGLDGSASSSSLQRWSLALGEEALRFEREEAVDGKPLEPRMYLSIDGTGIPMRKEDVEGVAGKQEDGSAKTREAKLAVMYTAEGRDPETGAAIKDRDSESFSCLRQRGRGVRKRGALRFRQAPCREARRRGLHDAGEVVVISDGAEWIGNTCEEVLGGGKVTFVLDVFHVLEQASGAVKAILPEGPERDRRFADVKADIEAGRAGKAVRELEPFSGRHKAVEDCCRHLRNNIERMKCEVP